jgi:hypothetical protein
MTAEIAILNRTGVALAADSAVTIGDSKVYNTVNKLFTLSKFHPVGIMIYGNADYMTIPWETIIKLYREQLGPKSLATVRDYAANFVRFLDRGFVIDKSDERAKIAQLWSVYFADLNQRFRRQLLKAAANQSLSTVDVSATLVRVLDDDIKRLRSLKTLRQYRSIRYRTLYRTFKTEFDENQKRHLRGRKLTPALKTRLREFAGLVLVKDEFAMGVTGIVIAGFGHDEIFPSMFHARCAGRLFGHIKLSVQKYISVTSAEDQSVYIRPFAQGEMVHRYMEGIDPAYSNYIEAGINQLVDRLSRELIMKHSSGTNAVKLKRVATAQKAAKKMTAELEKKAEQVRYTHFVRPVLEIVSLLPKEELAELAGALINITSLKRKISMDTESVGGPVDVAVISKGDGFIWIRRKHYFNTELNPYFTQKYLSLT